MSDQYTEVTSQGWLSRMGKSFAGIVMGIVMTIASFPALFWNEGRAVKRHQTLQEGAGVVASIAADQIDPAHEGKLVHVTGHAETKGTLTDPDFGLSVPGVLKLKRKVEMYQWAEDKRTETRNKLGGGTEKVTTYHYNKEWSAELERSSDFKNRAGHENPPAMPFPSSTLTADPITLGAFTLPALFVDRINQYSPLPEVSVDMVPEAIRAKVKAANGMFYVGANPQSPEIGDARVSFSTVKAGPYTLVGKQAGLSFEKYRTAAGGDLDLLQAGTKTAAEMFAAAEQMNKFLTWGLRAGFFVLMGVGLSLVAQPLRVMADVVPMAGRVVGMGVGFFAFVLAGIGSSATIAIAWVTYRPMIGIPILVVTGLLMFWLIARMVRSKGGRGLPADSPPPL